MPSVAPVTSAVGKSAAALPGVTMGASPPTSIRHLPKRCRQLRSQDLPEWGRGDQRPMRGYEPVTAIRPVGNFGPSRRQPLRKSGRWLWTVSRETPARRAISATVVRARPSPRTARRSLTPQRHVRRVRPSPCLRLVHQNRTAVQQSLERPRLGAGARRVPDRGIDRLHEGLADALATGPRETASLTADAALCSAWPPTSRPGTG